MSGSDRHDKYDDGDWSKPKQATPHTQLICELLNSRIPKTEREHAAVRKMLRLADTINNLLEALELISTAQDRGFGIDYAKGCALAAIAKARGQG